MEAIYLVGLSVMVTMQRYLCVVSGCYVSKNTLQTGPKNGILKRFQSQSPGMEEAMRFAQLAVAGLDPAYGLLTLANDGHKSAAMINSANQKLGKCLFLPHTAALSKLQIWVC